MRTLQPSSPSGKLAPLSTKILPTPKSVPTAVWIRDALSPLVVFRRPLTPYFGQFLRNFAHITTQMPNSLPTWTTGTCGSNRRTYCRQSLLSQQPPDQPTLPYSPPRHKCGELLAKTPCHLSSKTQVTLTNNCLGGHLQTHGDIEPSSVVLGEQTTLEKTTQRFQRIATTLADLNAEGLNAQAVNGRSKPTRASHELCA